MPRRVQTAAVRPLPEAGSCLRGAEVGDGPHVLPGKALELAGVLGHPSTITGGRRTEGWTGPRSRRCWPASGYPSCSPSRWGGIGSGARPSWRSAPSPSWPWLRAATSSRTKERMSNDTGSEEEGW